jgi:hypothetical protein
MTLPAAPHSHRPLDPAAALLSYLLPGLGQVVQGRVGKGLLFFVSLYGLFFYGMWMGQWRNVWLPDPVDLPAADLVTRQGIRVGSGDGFGKALMYRPQFLGQFWIGAAAWPAVAQYAMTKPPANGADPAPSPVLGRYMQAPTETELNTLQRDGNKRFDLGWVYTVIAGVLNILVIYDALAGPVVRDDEHDQATPPAPSGGASA